MKTKLYVTFRYIKLRLRKILLRNHNDNIPAGD